MENIAIIYLDDQREVLATIGKDLAMFEKWINLEESYHARKKRGRISYGA